MYRNFEVPKDFDPATMHHKIYSFSKKPRVSGLAKQKIQAMPRHRGKTFVIVEQTGRGIDVVSFLSDHIKETGYKHINHINNDSLHVLEIYSPL